MFSTKPLELHLNQPAVRSPVHLPPRRERRNCGRPRRAARRTGLPTGPSQRRRSCSVDLCAGQPRRVTAPQSLTLGRHAVGPPAPPRHAELPAGPPRRRAEEEEPQSRPARRAPAPSRHDAALLAPQQPNSPPLRMQAREARPDGGVCFPPSSQLLSRRARLHRRPVLDETRRRCKRQPSGRAQ